MEENRTNPRTMIVQTPIVGRGAKFRLQAQLLELSKHGARLRTPGELRPGQRIEFLGFRRAQKPAIACEVMWCNPVARGYEAGLRSEENLADTWLGRLLADREPLPREYERFPAAPASHLKLLTDSGVVSSVLVDIGLGGAQLTTEANLERGDLVRMEVAGHHANPVASVVARRMVEGRQVVHLRFLRPRQTKLSLQRIINSLIAS